MMDLELGPHKRENEDRQNEWNGYAARLPHPLYLMNSEPPSCHSLYHCPPGLQDLVNLCMMFIGFYASHSSMHVHTYMYTQYKTNTAIKVKVDPKCYVYFL